MTKQDKQKLIEEIEKQKSPMGAHEYDRFINNGLALAIEIIEQFEEADS